MTVGRLVIVLQLAVIATLYCVSPLDGSPAGPDEAATRGAPPVRWTAPWPDVSKPAAGFPQIDGVEHFPIYRAAPKTGVYSHHAHILHDGSTFYGLWSNHAHGEDGPGQRVFWATSADGRDWSGFRVAFPARGPTRQPEDEGRVLTANGLLMLDGAVYAVAEVHDNIGFTDASRETVVERRSRQHPMRARRGHGRMACRLKADGVTGPIFWLVDNPPEPLPGSAAYPDAVDPRFADLAGRINEHQRQPLGHPFWNFRGGDADGPAADRYPAPAADGHWLCEPTTYRRPDGTLVRLFRDLNHSHRMYAAVRPRCREWSTPQPTNIPDSPSRSHAGRLPDGRVYLIGNQVCAPLDGSGKRSHYTRDPLVLSLSSDGREFDTALSIRAGSPPIRHPGKGKGRGYQYPHSIVVGDSLWVIYSIGKEDVAVSRVPIGSLPPIPGL